MPLSVSPTYGTAEPLSPTDLNITVDGTNLIVSWREPFSLEGEELSYVVSTITLGLQAGEEVILNTTSYEFTGPDGPRNCEEYNFTIFSMNDFSRSRSGVSQKQTIPTGSANLVVYIDYVMHIASMCMYMYMYVIVQKLILIYIVILNLTIFVSHFMA